MFLPYCIVFQFSQQRGDEEGGVVPQTQGEQERGVGGKGEVACYCSPKHMNFWLCTDAV